jgi:hypothetical protein
MKAITVGRRSIFIALTLGAFLGLSACGGGTAEPADLAPVDSTAVANSTVTAQAVKVAPAAQAPKTDSSGTTGASRQSPNYLTGQVKWHPGHYVLLSETQAPNVDYMNKIVAELEKNPALRGVQVRYPWAELEPVKGQYNFDRIQRDLGLMSKAGKHLFILLETKSFGSNDTVIPTYFDTDISGGGAFDIVASSNDVGRNIKLWNAQVENRLIALVTQLGKRFNQSTALEGIALTETALGTPVTPITATQQTTFFNNLLQVNQAMRTAFPNTVTMQFVNYPMSILPSFVPALGEMAGAMGGPDVLIDDPDLLRGVYPYYPALAGQVPLGPSVQNEDYDAKYHNGPYDPPTIDELYQFARNELRANYIFWFRRAYKNDNPYQGVLNYMASPSFPKDASGGLASACPAQYVSCVD